MGRRSSKNLKNARWVALEILEYVDKGLHIQEAVNCVFNAMELEEKDKRLASELAYGFLRSEMRLRFILDRLLAKPDNLPPKVIYLLAQAVYTRLFLDRIPFPVAVSEAVALAHNLFGAKLAKVVNGVLRACGRLGEAICHPSFYRLPEDNDNLSVWRSLALYASLPFWLVQFWRQAYGDTACLHLMRRSLARPSKGLRVNCQHPLASKLQQDLSENTHFLCGQNLQFWLQEGALSYQSLASQKILTELGLQRWRGEIWDLCAGHGGKTTALLEHGVQVSLCADLSWKRLSSLPAECRRLHLQIPDLCVLDTSVLPLGKCQGNILLDVPCSGLGVLARRPDLKRQRQTRQTLDVFPPIQRALLTHAVSLLARGREIAYLTCTLNPAENERLIESFLQKHPEMQIVCQYQTPHDQIELDGMYGVLLRKL